MITPSSLPLDSFKQVREHGAILRFRTRANAVGQDGFQQFEFTPAKIGLLVHNNSG